MDTATLLVVIGCGVLVKTLAFVGVLLRRERRQQRILAEARAATVRSAARAAPADLRPAPTVSPWRLQWAEPGVLLLENASEVEPAREVEVSATLTTGGGQLASVVRHQRFVGTGACFAVRFTELEESLSDAVLLDPVAARELLTGRLDLALTWMGSDGEVRSESRPALAVVPVPDLALEIA